MSIEKILNKRSNAVVTEEGVESPKKPTSSQLDNGEIAVNYHKGVERMFMKNDNDEVVEFVSKDKTEEVVDTKINEELTINDVLDADVLAETGEEYNAWKSPSGAIEETSTVGTGTIVDLSDNPVTIGELTFNHSFRKTRIEITFNFDGKVKIWTNVYRLRQGASPSYYLGVNRYYNPSQLYSNYIPVKAGDKFITHDDSGLYYIYYQLCKVEFISDFKETVLSNLTTLNNFDKTVYTKTQVDELIPTSLSELSEDSEHRTITDKEQIDYDYVSEQFKDYTTVNYKNQIGEWNNTSITIPHDGELIFENYSIFNNASIGGGNIKAVLTRNNETITLYDKSVSPHATQTLNEVFEVLEGDVINFTNGLVTYSFGSDNIVYLKYFDYRILPTKTSDLTNDSGFLTEHQKIKTINSTTIVGEGNLDVVTGVTINNTTKTPTNGTVNLGTVLTSTTSYVTSGSTTPITSGGVYNALQGKQNTIDDLVTIRSGAQAGATAVQPVQGKGLSTNDYTNDDKGIITSIADLPTAKQLVIGDIIITLNLNGTVTWAEVPHLTANDLYSISDTALGVSLLEVDPQYPDEPASGTFVYGPSNPYPLPDDTFTPHLTIAVADTVPTATVESEMSVKLFTGTQYINYGPFSVTYSGTDGNGHNLYTVQNVPTVEADDCIFFYILDADNTEIGNSSVFVAPPMTPQVTTSNESVGGIPVLTEAYMMYSTGVGNLSFSPNLQDGDTIRLKGTVVDTTQSYPDLTFDFTGTINGTAVVPGDPSNIIWNSGSTVSFEYLVPSLGAFGLCDIDERDGCRIKMQGLQIWVNGVECVIN